LTAVVFVRGFSGNASRRERRLQVVPANRPRNIEHFATKIKAAANFRSHRLQIDLVERNATGNYLALVEINFLNASERKRF
jgi:hypothetical protein